MRSLHPAIERTYWWWMLRTSTTTTLSGLRFVYISAEGNRPRDEIQKTLEDAIERIGRARGGFGELVTSHLRFVAALDVPSSSVAVHARGYISPFPTMEATNAHFLACRVIWAATFVRLTRDAMHAALPRDSESIRRAAYEAQLRFTKQFSDAQEWVEYLERHPSGI